jgi:hypothetical protein
MTFVLHEAPSVDWKDFKQIGDERSLYEFVFQLRVFLMCDGISLWSIHSLDVWRFLLDSDQLQRVKLRVEIEAETFLLDSGTT